MQSIKISSPRIRLFIRMKEAADRIGLPHPRPYNGADAAQVTTGTTLGAEQLTKLLTGYEAVIADYQAEIDLRRADCEEILRQAKEQAANPPQE